MNASTAVAAAPLTRREQQVMDFLRVFLALNDQLPPCRAIAAAFGWTSANAADEVLRSMERKGSLARNELGNRMLARRTAGPA